MDVGPEQWVIEQAKRDRARQKELRNRSVPGPPLTRKEKVVTTLVISSILLGITALVSGPVIYNKFDEYLTERRYQKTIRRLQERYGSGDADGYIHYRSGYNVTFVVNGIELSPQSCPRIEEEGKGHYIVSIDDQLRLITKKRPPEDTRGLKELAADKIEVPGYPIDIECRMRYQPLCKDCRAIWLLNGERINLFEAEVYEENDDFFVLKTLEHGKAVVYKPGRTLPAVLEKQKDEMRDKYRKALKKSLKQPPHKKPNRKHMRRHR